MTALESVGYTMLEPTPEEFEEMPEEFRTAPAIIDAYTDVGFNTDGAWAQGVMEYLATTASQEVTLVVRFADREVARKSAKGAEDHFLPAGRTLRTMVSIPLSGSCGHVADGHTAHKAWHKFLVSGWKLLSWGEDEDPSGGVDYQTACPEPPPTFPGNGGGEDPYEGSCEVCQQWFYFIDGRLTAEWWECTEVDPSVCGFEDTR